MNKIGYFDADVVTPEEIIMAAGFIPMRLLGDPNIGLDKANVHVPPTHCVWARNVFEQAIRGLSEDVEGVITSHGCDCTNREFDLWLENTDIEFMYFLNVPLKQNESSIDFYINDMKELIKQMEEKFKISITDDKLKESIILMNQIRRLLKQLSEYRKTMQIKSSEFHHLVRKVQTQDKQESLKMLKKELEQVKQNDTYTQDNLKKVLLTGSEIDDSEFIEFLESLGFHIIIDDIGVGTRYFWNQVDESEEPLRALAKFYLKDPIFSTKFPSYHRLDFLKKLAQDYHVDGVINVAMKFCEPLLYSHPYFDKKFKELEIPYLFIESEYNRESYKQLSTRFEAFAEMIEKEE
ncbi:MAG: hypothetical protein GF383_06985 [Candidatus Lokiarchaeota archaeon]|nr:hypothetical protein [Candidatus Lokiarchaeota archaeon]MBD3339894.1 hypothetical protein [Candidatus Lokiarchaeota archaeon]